MLTSNDSNLYPSREDTPSFQILEKHMPTLSSAKP